jgi:hypothetical protein
MPIKPALSLMRSIELKNGRGSVAEKPDKSYIPEYRFVFWSNDEYIKRVLLSMGWFQTKTKGDLDFHLKWTTNDTPTDYQSLKEGQLFNHIQHSEELTNKAKLTSNLTSMRADFYPRTYDLSVSYFEFVSDFTMTGILCLLKRFVELIKLKNHELYDHPIKCHLGDVLKNSEFTALKHNSDFYVNIGLAIHLCLYL